ncbi:hypothetical protein FFLO_01330 [Filobasidium floriforme]|uniref:Protein CPL1-like domain-containing protein n=1 Tax=Filobasidium floriforme TaxID=5210 RepID=A0A8K0NV06_9TREE|nr:hypothetical protein FFLO_01330 [Filobasidium floriforme]
MRSSLPLYTQLAALALLFLAIVPTARATGSVFDIIDNLFDNVIHPPANAQPVKGTTNACKCLQSISLPNFQGYLTTDEVDKNGDLNLDLTYNVGQCKNRQITVKLVDPKKGQSVSCCKNPREKFQADFFYGYDGKNSELDLSIYLGGGPGKNKCEKKTKDVCTPKTVGQKFQFEISVAGCNQKKVFEFGCVANPTPSHIKHIKARSEAILGLPPRHFRCPAGGRVCPVAGTGATKQWECVQDNDIESCGGCPGTEDAQDCTDIAGVSAVQCMNKTCIVAKCLRGHTLVDNECVKDVELVRQQNKYAL